MILLIVATTRADDEQCRCTVRYLQSSFASFKVIVRAVWQKEMYKTRRSLGVS